MFLSYVMDTLLINADFIPEVSRKLAHEKLFPIFLKASDFSKYTGFSTGDVVFNWAGTSQMELARKILEYLETYEQGVSVSLHKLQRWAVLLEHV